MIDPVNVTNYERSADELQEFLLFTVLVAGKHAGRTALALDKLIRHGRIPCRTHTPFQAIRFINQTENLAERMKKIGFGCYNRKAEYIVHVVTSALDLRHCSIEQLESIPGIGPKTARYFVLHSRENAQVACLDTHVLKWLAYYTRHRVPKSTPTRKKYLELEKVFLRIADVMNILPADLDLAIWNKERGTHAELLAKKIPRKTKALLDG